MQVRKNIIPIEITKDKIIHVQATVIGNTEQDISSRLPSFKGVVETIEEISSAIAKAIEKVKPHKASVEFGLEIGVESGKITSILMQGSTSANIKIKLEW